MRSISNNASAIDRGMPPIAFQSIDVDVLPAENIRFS